LTTPTPDGPGFTNKNGEGAILTRLSQDKIEKPMPAQQQTLAQDAGSPGNWQNFEDVFLQESAYDQGAVYVNSVYRE
jgi:hypothetical protein